MAVRDPIGTLVVSMDCKYSGLNIQKMKQVQRRSSVVAGQHGAGAVHKIAARNRHFVAVRDPIGTVVVSMD